VQIRFEILEFLYYNAGFHSRTTLWRRSTQLSYDDFLKYLEYLKTRGFVEESDLGVRLTSQGRDVYLKLRDALPSIL
jgi:predicted transcriptional regulator